jgi:hypothetical protein
VSRRPLLWALLQDRRLLLELAPQALRFPQSSA